MAGSVFRRDLANGAFAADRFIERRIVIMSNQDKASQLSIHSDTGKQGTHEVAETWIHDKVASLTQPVRALLLA